MKKMSGLKTAFVLASVTGLAGCFGGGSSSGGGGLGARSAIISTAEASDAVRTAVNDRTEIGASVRTPQSGSDLGVTQSSNPADGGASTTVRHVTGGSHFDVRVGGSAWSAVKSGPDPIDLGEDFESGINADRVRRIAGLPVGSRNWEGIEMAREAGSGQNAGTVTIQAYTDIEAPADLQGGDAMPRTLQTGEVFLFRGPDAIPTGGNFMNRRGTLDAGDIPGTFSCEGTCSGINGDIFSVQDGDTVTFTPDGTAPDTDYLTMGMWLFVPQANQVPGEEGIINTANIDVGVFAYGSDPFNTANIPALIGTANYIGGATGIHGSTVAAGTSRLSVPALAYFNADIDLTADFGSNSARGTIGGFIDNIRLDDGTAYQGRINLGSTGIGDAPGGFFTGSTDIPASGEDRLMRGGVTYQDATGRWGGKFFGNGGTGDQPGSVAGTFGAEIGPPTGYAGTVNLLGSFGAYRQLPALPAAPNFNQQ